MNHRDMRLKTRRDAWAEVCTNMSSLSLDHHGRLGRLGSTLIPTRQDVHSPPCVALVRGGYWRRHAFPPSLDQRRREISTPAVANAEPCSTVNTVQTPLQHCATPGASPLCTKKAGDTG